jgi:hypothetical protein
MSAKEATMAEPAGNSISVRLRRLPGQLLLALLNATAILVIVAAILALVAIARIEHFAGSIVATMTEAVLAKIDLPSREVLGNIRNLTGEVRALRSALADIKARENTALQSEVARLRETLTVLTASVDRLGSARSMLTDEAVARLGGAIADALIRFRHCSSDAGPNGAASRLQTAGSANLSASQSPVSPR